MCKSRLFRIMWRILSRKMDTFRDISPYSNNSLNNPDIRITSMEWCIPKQAHKQNIITTQTRQIHLLKINYKTFNPLMISLLITGTLTCRLMDNWLLNILVTVLSEISSGKNRLNKDRESTFCLMGNLIMVTGRIIKCMVMGNYFTHIIKSDTKVNLKMACLMDLVHNMLSNK